MSACTIIDATSELDMAEAATTVLESRVHQRTSVDFPVEIHGKGWCTPLKARARDISMMGICVATPFPFILDEVEGLILHTSFGDIWVEVESRWQTCTGSDVAVLSGMSLINLTPALSATIWGVFHDSAQELGGFLYTSLKGVEPTIDEAIGTVQSCRIRVAERHKYLYQRGQITEGDESIFIVKKGEVELVLPIERAADIQVSLLGPGEIFGGLVATTATRNFESARATEETVLLEISRSAFAYMRLAKPLLAHWLAGLVVQSHLQRMEGVLNHAVGVLQR